MKYIISESRLNKIIDDYLESFSDSLVLTTTDNYIILSQKNEESDSWIDYIEYDKSDGRLWIYINFLQGFIDLFAFPDKESAQSYISKWFSDKFGVEIEYVE